MKKLKPSNRVLNFLKSHSFWSKIVGGCCIGIVVLLLTGLVLILLEVPKSLYGINPKKLTFNKWDTKTRKWKETPIDEYVVHCIELASKDTGVKPAIAFALCYAESRFNPEAFSSSGAQGLFQLKWKTAVGRAKAIEWHAQAMRIKREALEKRPRYITLRQIYLNARLGLEYWKWIIDNKESLGCHDWIDGACKYSSKDVRGSYILDIKNYYFKITGKNIAMAIK